ncbi:hypothetical protein DESA109040_20610 [Deinococcus saxicola]
MRDLKDAIRKKEFEKVTIISSDMRRSIVKLKTETDLEDKISSDRLSDLVTFFGSIESNFGIEDSVGVFDLESFNFQEDYLIEIREIVKRAVESEKV